MEAMDYIQRQNLRITELEKSALYLNYEIERWRHSVNIEGDYVCPRDLECDALRAEVERLHYVQTESEMLKADYQELVEQRNRLLAEGE